MGAGLMQLMFFGSQDIYLKGNPSITFFKKIFKTHTNFSMESIRLEFNKMDTNIYEKTILKAKIPRHADLVAQMYFVFDLPEIISDSIMNFRWIENIGEGIIDNYYISIGGSIIDKQYGEFLHLSNTLTYPYEKKESFDKLTGNIMSIYNPEQYALITNNINRPPLRYRIGSAYPVGYTNTSNDSENYRPSIPTRKIYVPMTFWFNKNISSALPLISLQYSEVELTVELRPWVELYTLFYTKNGILDSYAPNLNIQAHQLKNFVSNFKQKFLISDTIIDCRPHIEANYIYLDKIEREYFAFKPIDYLIEQVTRIDRYNIKENETIDMILQNPVKEILWVMKRNDQKVKNNWFTYLDNNEKILKTAKILFNGEDRIAEKDGDYYNYLQPFQHHRGSPKEGLYVYSFSLFPDDLDQPSGSCNMSRINNVQFYVTTKKTNDDNYKYDSTFYIINYNFLRFSAGLCGLVFST